MPLTKIMPISAIIENELFNYYHNVDIIKNKRDKVDTMSYYYTLECIQNGAIEHLEKHLLALNVEFKDYRQPILTAGKIKLWNTFLRKQRKPFSREMNDIDSNNWQPRYQYLIDKITDKFTELKNGNQ